MFNSNGTLYSKVENKSRPCLLQAMPLAPVGRAVPMAAPAVTSPTCPRTGPQVTLARHRCRHQRSPRPPGPRPHPRGTLSSGRRDGPRRASPRDAHSLRAPAGAGTGIPAGCSLTSVRRNTGKRRKAAGMEGWMEPCGLTRGDGGTSEHGAPSATRVGAGMPTPLRQTPSGKKAAASLGEAPGCLCLGDGRWREQGATLALPFPTWEGDAVATLRGN